MEPQPPALVREKMEPQLVLVVYGIFYGQIWELEFRSQLSRFSALLAIQGWVPAQLFFCVLTAIWVSLGGAFLLAELAENIFINVPLTYHSQKKNIQ